MDLAFIPRNQLVARLHDGWKLLPGHEYEWDEYAILMVLRPDAEPAEAGMMDFIMNMFTEPKPEQRRKRPTYKDAFGAIKKAIGNRCSKGHRLTEDNIYWDRLGYGNCRECRRIAQRKYRAKELACP